MHWSDEAIVLSVKKHGESSAVARLFVREHGVFSGVLKGANSKANRGILQPGNSVIASWNARLPEHMGMWKAELAKPHAAFIMQDAMKLAALSSACALIEAAMPERHPYPKLYKQFDAFLDELVDHDNWQEDYVKLELGILAESGFGLDLKRCAATGSTDDLIYVSPKSGRAVSREAGEPYKDKMLTLPAFLLPSPALAGEGWGGGLTSHARKLRKNMTDVEQSLWYQLRAHRFKGYGFRRQRPMGNYIVDFICMEKRLIVELDGGQHAEQQNYDAKRTAYLESQGYRVIRFWNNDVLENMEGVLTRILESLEAPLSNSPPLRGREDTQFPLPEGGRVREGAEIQDGLALTGYFLEHWLLEPHHRKMPAARGRLITILNQLKGEPISAIL